MKNKLVCLLIMFLSMAMILSACAKSPNPAETDPGEPKEVDLSEPKYGGRLNATVSAEPGSLDITVKAYSSESSQIPAIHIFEKLLESDLQGNAHPMLCTYETSEDGLTLTLTMRENVKFHNGDTMDIDDIKASIDRWLKNSSFAKKAVGDKLDSIEYPDDKTIVFNFKEIAPLALTALCAYDQGSYVMPKEIIEAAGDDKVSEYIGTGPYKFEEWLTDRHIKLVRFDDYQPYESDASGMAGTKHAYVDELYIIPVKDKMTRITGVQTGDYDIGFGVPDNMYPQLAADPNLKCTIQDLGIFASMVFNYKQGPTADENFRKAIIKCLDMNDLMLAAQGSPDFYYLHPCWMPKTSAYWNEVGSDVYNKPDLEEAERLLALTDYAGETLTFITTKDYDYYYKTALLVCDSIRKIGINVEMQVYDNATMQELRGDTTKYNIFSSGLTAKDDPTLIAFMDEGWPGEYSSERKSEIMSKLVSEPDPQKRMELWEEACRIIYDELPAVTFGERRVGTVTSNKVQNLFEGTRKHFWNIWVTE